MLGCADCGVNIDEIKFHTEKRGEKAITEYRHHIVRNGFEWHRWENENYVDPNLGESFSDERKILLTLELSNIESCKKRDKTAHQTTLSEFIRQDLIEDLFVQILTIRREEGSASHKKDLVVLTKSFRRVREGFNWRIVLWR